MIYLAEKCPRFSNSMYPKCTKTRAVINQRLFHDSSELYVRILDIANLAFSKGSQALITVQHRDNLRKAMTVLEVFMIPMISVMVHIRIVMVFQKIFNLGF